MKETDGRAPAFPQMCADALDVGMVHTGISERDYLAAKALVGLLAAMGKNGEVNYLEATVARRAYGLADAMLAERKK